jgi:hypothetical protein
MMIIIFADALESAPGDGRVRVRAIIAYITVQILLSSMARCHVCHAHMPSPALRRNPSRQGWDGDATAVVWSANSARVHAKPLMGGELVMASARARAAPPLQHHNGHDRATWPVARAAVARRRCCDQWHSGRMQQAQDWGLGGVPAADGPCRRRGTRLVRCEDTVH